MRYAELSPYARAALTVWTAVLLILFLWLAQFLFLRKKRGRGGTSLVCALLCFSLLQLQEFCSRAVADGTAEWESRLAGVLPAWAFPGAEALFTAVAAALFIRLRKELRQPDSYTAYAEDRLAELSEAVAKYTIEKEVLDAKIRIHDELGKMLLTAKRYLSAGNRDKSALIAEWRRNNRLLLNETPDEPPPDGYAYMLQVARDVGIQVVLDGVLPEGPAEKKVVTAAIHECLTNTLRHAEGSRLNITAGEDRVVFTNDGRQPETEITESGGLLSLRRLAEHSGMEMKVESFPRFRLTLYRTERRRNVQSTDL